ncbi:hypothetical protein HMPREF9134_01515 [Porphyromonas catoniae F0037]|uniref:Uncharacterized protein n=1 Tax=Porphyromonas catoniae F0037 TaxID=1127696 RepID=L1NA81_9PORP|nr:hypothetical protein HMPREF9134_01515 [Porphyromonas catoniae F0037]
MTSFIRLAFACDFFLSSIAFGLTFPLFPLLLVATLWWSPLVFPLRGLSPCA